MWKMIDATSLFARAYWATVGWADTCLDIDMREFLYHNAQAQSDAHHVRRRFRFLMYLSFFPSFVLFSLFLYVLPILILIPIRSDVSTPVIAFRVFPSEDKNVQKPT